MTTHKFGSFVLEGSTITYEVITNEDGTEFIRMTIVDEEGSTTVIEIPIGTGNFGSSSSSDDGGGIVNEMVSRITLSLLTGCASFPQWSENPQDCSRWNEFSKDLYTGVKKQLSGNTFVNILQL